MLLKFCNSNFGRNINRWPTQRFNLLSWFLLTKRPMSWSSTRINSNDANKSIPPGDVRLHWQLVTEVTHAHSWPRSLSFASLCLDVNATWLMNTILGVPLSSERPILSSVNDASRHVAAYNKGYCLFMMNFRGREQWPMMDERCRRKTFLSFSDRHALAHQTNGCWHSRWLLFSHVMEVSYQVGFDSSCD